MRNISREDPASQGRPLGSQAVLYCHYLVAVIAYGLKNKVVILAGG